MTSKKYILPPLKWLVFVFFLPVYLLSGCSIVDQQPTTQEASRAETESAKTITAETEAGSTNAPNKNIYSGEKTSRPGIDIAELIPNTEYTTTPSDNKQGEASSTENDQTLIDNLCAEVGAKLGSVDASDCLEQLLLPGSGKSVEGRALAYKNYPPQPSRKPLGRVLVIGGIHGDEFSSVSVVFRWMDILNKHHTGMFDWRFIPLSNPDGLLQEKSQRQNANGVDLNRNFPTADWSDLALTHWREKANSHPRRYPGPRANSELEIQWLVQQIDEFKPDVIVSMHAPYHLVDYDGPPDAPDRLGSLYLRKLGVFPGSLGNYAGVDLNVPIVTVELSSAGIMPRKQEISSMWDDLIRWLRTKLED